MVTLDYTVFNTHDELLDSGAKSLVYLHGNYGEIFPKIEKALEGKQLADSIHLQLSPEDAFGEYNHDLVLVEDRRMFEDDLALDQQIEMVFGEDDEEIVLSYTVREIKDDKVVLDANHPLAGVSIIFDATVIGVREATHDEIEQRLSDPTFTEHSSSNL